MAHTITKEDSVKCINLLRSANEKDITEGKQLLWNIHKQIFQIFIRINYYSSENINFMLEDFLHDTYISALESVGRIKEPKELFNFLWSLIQRQRKGKLSKVRTIKKFVLSYDALETSDRAFGYQVNVENEIYINQVDELINKAIIDETHSLYKQILIYRFLENKSDEEIRPLINLYGHAYDIQKSRAYRQLIARVQIRLGSFKNTQRIIHKNLGKKLKSLSAAA